MFAVVPALVLMMGLLAVVMASVKTRAASTEGRAAQLDAENAARAVISLFAEDFWTDFDEAIDVDSAQIWEFQAYLESQGLVDMAGAEDIEPTSILGRIELPQGQDGRPRFAGAVIEEATAYRLDGWDSTSVVVEVTALAERGTGTGRRYAVQEIFEISPPPWDGLDYALLANNVNCVLCHTSIDNAERYYNTDESKRGTFAGVKMGTIESLHFRSNPDTKIAGSVYVGGDAMQGDGDSIADWSRFNFKAAEMDSDGDLVEDAWGGLSYSYLERPDENDPTAPASLLLGDDQDIVGDSFLPETFPSPFPDNGGVDPVTGSADEELAGNRVIDDTEFMAKVGGSDGRISGGSISLIEKGDRIDTMAELSAMRNGKDTAVEGVVEKNVFLHGTKNDPIILDGDIAVDGDVIISGYVKGEGSIQARGNVYVPSDLIFADGSIGGSRTYRTAEDGSRNTLALAAGGNILVGDYYKPAWNRGAPATGDSSGSFNFVMDEVAIFNRMEWIKSQPTLPGKEVKVQTGTRTTYKTERVKETYQQQVTTYKWVKDGRKKVAVYKKVKVKSGSGPYAKTTTKKVFSHYKWKDTYKKVATGHKMVTKTRWVKTGRKIPVVKPVYEWQTPAHANPYYGGDDYVARYYSFAEGKKAPIFNKKGYFDPATGHWHGDERAGAFDSSKLSYADINDPNDPFFYAADGTPKAVLSTMAPTADWIAPTQMQKLIDLSLAQRKNKNDPFEINSTLYSSNAIFGVIAKDGHTRGKLLVNGGIVAADIGLLSPRGTQLNFDGSGSQRLNLTSNEGLTIRRAATLPMPRS